MLKNIVDETNIFKNVVRSQKYVDSKNVATFCEMLMKNEYGC
jgi:hypothetical protein